MDLARSWNGISILHFVSMVKCETEYYIWFKVKKCSSKKERDDLAKYYLQLIGLTGFEKHYPIQLSGGMKQRVAIARALANDPKILIMDEPFGALDAQTRTIMQEVLLKAWEESKKTILFITHDVDESIFLADSVYVMTARPGRLKKKIPITLERPREFSMKSTGGIGKLQRGIIITYSGRKFEIYSLEILFLLPILSVAIRLWGSILWKIIGIIY